MVFSPICGKLK